MSVGETSKPHSGLAERLSSLMRPVADRVIHWRRALASVGSTFCAAIVAAGVFAPTVSAPLAVQSARHDGGFLYIAPVESIRGRFYWLSSDWDSRPEASRLHLFEDGKPLGPAHSVHGAVRELGGGRFIHWGTELWFSTSDGTDPRLNQRSYEIRSRLSLKPVWTTAGFAAIALAFIAFVTSLRAGGRAGLAVDYARRVTHFLSNRLHSAWRPGARLLLRSPLLLMRVIAYLLLVAAAVYVVAIIYALLTGSALPTAAPIQSSSLGTLAAEWEPLFHLMLIFLAMLGAAASWLSFIIFRGVAVQRRDELLLGRFLRRWGVFLAVALSVFSVSAIWAGVPRADDLNWASIAGLIPFSDANGYFAATHDQAKDGSWNVISLRRPLAAAFRSTMMFAAGFAFANAILLQVGLLACAAFVAARAIGQWRGVYAGLVFFALSYVTVRLFLPTFLTEPLGLFWAMVAIPFLIASLRDGSLKNGLLGFAMVAVALSMRPGAMFVIAALGLWLVWRFGENARQRFLTAAYTAGLFVLVVGASQLASKAYGQDSTVTGSNFSYTLCGLSIGTAWSGCLDRYEEVKNLTSEKQLTDFLYEKAVENIAAQPEVIVSRLYLSASLFSKELPAVLWRGYSWRSTDTPNLRGIFLALAIAGLIFLFVRRRGKGEIAFWVLIWAGVIASAAFVHFDDGRRVMIVGYPLLWMFLASGLTTARLPTAPLLARPRLPIYGAAGLVGAGILFLAIPWLAHRMSPAPDLRRGLVMPSTPSEHVVLAGRRVTGVMVVADDQPLRTDITTLHLARFAELIKQSNIEMYQGILSPLAPTTPFGFIWAPRLEPRAHSDFQYIVPVEVMQRTDVKVWKFRVREWNRKQPYGPVLVLR